MTLQATGDPERPLSLPAGSYVTLTVTKTGIGMDATARASIFRPFFTTTTDGHGTGPRLWIVREIADRYGGGIDVRTTSGAGTAFAIYFPNADEPVHG